VSGYAARIAERLDAAELSVTPAQLDRLAAYLELLSKWNRTINLTSLDLKRPSDGAIDRLIVESVCASQLIVREVLTSLDVGSGGGSPSLPLKIISPALFYTLVESRSRKCAFLREAVRVLELSDVRVEQARLEDVAQRPSARYSFDLVTMRAVRPDEKLWEALRALLKPGGRLLWFGARDEAMPADSIVLEDRPVAMLLQMPGVGR
jgi:16S rRNA (guanine527-N7)-methyltransferase